MHIRRLTGVCENLVQEHRRISKLCLSWLNKQWLNIYIFYLSTENWSVTNFQTQSVLRAVFFIFLFFPFIFISWRLITLQYCSGFCHTLTWISHRFTCIPHPDPPSHLPPHPIPLGLLSAPAPSTCLMHPTWTGDLFPPW